MPVMLTMLCGDIPWSPGGIYRCLDITSESGTINDCDFPAGVSKGSIASAWATQNAVTEVLGAMLDTHPVYRSDLTSVCVGSWDLALLAGIDQRGGPFVNVVSDPMAGGFGARSDQDGVDTGGLACIPMGRTPDVEMSEFSYPMLYLWRREEPDSGGPGRFRGGLGGSCCFMMHGSPAPALHMTVSGGGKALPQSSGASGGYPGNTEYDVAVRDSDIHQLIGTGRMLRSLDDLAGEREVMPPHLITTLGQHDVYYMAWQGGGGYGDPILRDPAQVAADLTAGKITAGAARDIYGVIITAEGGADQTATEQARAAIRGQRLADARPQTGE
jgi:N-methylhydantoinase B